ncbi:ankyrin [Anaeromyces robustus]|uniref:Ankyrin n=1 Tax=Anaeromyces robustus TaxID=1754192 RepID=A0A1Y1WXT4_9FUNG|nr:ankyrin [Anaeromyces robustus]|eukprot:ORX77934.1 ankyrin [Anaeromyces robustus]
MDINHDYPLIVSIYCGTPAIFNFLLENGANVNIKDNNGNSILNIALNKPSYLKYLFSKKSINININEKDVSGNYPLMTAIYKNDINSVKSIVRYGTTHGEDMSNILNNNGYTPLILAYKLKYKVVFGCLLRYLDVNAKDLNKNTILYYAIMEEDVTTVSDLIKYGANVNFIDKNGNTPLHLAIYKKNKQIILNLLNSSHNLLLNVPNNQNDIPLVYLIKSLNVYTNDYKEIISLLIKKGTNVNYIDKKGNTPLVYAIKKNFVSVVELLINNGANVNHYIIERDESPLMYAIGLNSISMVKCLVNHNADTNFKNSKNKTVLMKASLTNLEIYNCVSNNNINNY